MRPLKITVNGKDFENIENFSVQEDATPIDPSSSFGGAGQITFNAQERDDSRRLTGEVVLVDGSRGKTSGVLTEVNGTNGDLSITADSILGLFNVERTVPPYVGTLEGAINFYCDFVGIPNNVVVDSDLATRSVTCPGWKGNVWVGIKQFLAAQQVELALVFDRIYVRNLRKFTANLDRSTTQSFNINRGNVARAVEVNYYNNYYGEDAEVYPRAGEEPTIFVVDAGETVTFREQLNASLFSVNQPEMQEWVDNDTYDHTNGVYSVVGNDGLPIPVAQWKAQGGKLEVRMTDDPSVIEIEITGASMEEYAPYRIAMSSGDGTYYNSLHITGDAVLTKQESIIIHTGAKNVVSNDPVGVVVENPFISTKSQAFSLGMKAAAAYAGLNYTISGSAMDINREEGIRDVIQATFVDFDNEVGPGYTFTKFNTDWSGKTFTDFNAYWQSRVDARFDNQLFGNAIGARVKDEYANFRITSATTKPDLIDYTATLDTTLADFNERWGGNNAVTDYNLIYNARPSEGSTTGWSVSPGTNTTLTRTTDGGEPCIQLAASASATRTLTLSFQDSVQPQSGQWVAFAIDIKRVNASSIAAAFRLRAGSNPPSGPSITTGWTQNQWVRQVVSVQMTAPLDHIFDVFISVGTGTGTLLQARRASLAFADTKEDAEAAAFTFFDGDTADTPIEKYHWYWGVGPGLSVRQTHLGARYDTNLVPNPKPLLGSGSVEYRRNLVTNPKPASVSGGVEYRRNYALLPVPTSTTSYSFQNKSGGAYTSTLVTGAADGPVPGLATYLRRTVTTGSDQTGAWGPYSYTTAPGPVVVGSTWTVSVYVRCSTSVSARLSVSGRTGGALQGTAASGPYVTLPAGQWVRLSMTFTADAAAEHIGWWVNSTGPYLTGMTFDTTGVLVEQTGQVLPYFDGATTPDLLHIPSWTGTPGASASVLTAPVPAGWSASGGETAIFVSDDDDDPCVELIDPVGGGSGTLFVALNMVAAPGTGRWVAFGIDVKPLSADQATRMRLHVRTQVGGTSADSATTTAGVGWTAGQWTRQVVSVQQSATADRITAVVWPTATPNPGAQFRARRAVVAFADTQEEAEAAVATYFDGSTTYDPLLVPSWTGTPDASASVLTAQTPTGWSASPGETAVLVTDDDGEPCVEFIDPVGGGGGYLWVLNSVADTPGVGRWVALGVDVKPLSTDQASRMSLRVRTQQGNVNVDQQYLPGGVGWTAGQWTRQVVSVQQTATADNVDALVLPTDTPNPGAQFRARRAVVAFADTKEEAEALAATYWDGDTPATSDVYYVWSGTPHNSVSYRVQGARTIKNWNAQFKNMTFKDFSIEPLRKDNV